MTTGRATVGLSLCSLDAYHRSSGGMRLVRDLSSSAASRESSVEGKSAQGVCCSKELGPCTNWGCSSVVRHSHDMHKALGSIPRTTKLPCILGT